MFKFIIILVLLIYILNKVSALIFRVVGQPKQNPPFRRPDNSGNIRMDTAPKKSPKKNGLKGGEYVDYEEVK